MGAQRALAAIVFTDAVGFSTRTNQNEAEAFRLLDADLTEMRDLAATHQGQVLKTLGDGLLLVFGSAVQAVAFSLDVQQHLASRAEVAGVEPLRHRLGVHVGDVMLSEDDAQGDGVNIARRLQETAETNGIRISGTVYEVVRSRIALDARDLGEPELKGIETPIRVYEISPFVTTLEAEKPAAKAAKPASRGNAVLVGVVGLAAVIGYLAFGSRLADSRADSRAADPEKVAKAPAPAVVASPQPNNAPATRSLTEAEINAIATRLAAQMVEESRQQSRPSPSEPQTTQLERANPKAPERRPDKRVAQPIDGPTNKPSAQPSPKLPIQPPSPAKQPTGPGMLSVEGMRKFEAEMRRLRASTSDPRPNLPANLFPGGKSLESARRDLQEKLPEFGSIREAAVKSYDFASIANWLQKQPNFTGKKELERNYTELESFKVWVLEELSKKSSDRPVVIRTQRGELSLWGQDGGLQVAAGGASGNLRLESLRPEMFRLIAIALTQDTSNPRKRMGEIRRFEREFDLGMRFGVGSTMLTPRRGPNPKDQ